MEMVVYIDAVFALNSLLDGLLLYFTGYLAGVERKNCRLLLAALLGGVYAAASFFPVGGLLGAPPGKVLCGAALVLLAYGGGDRFGRLCLVFLGLSCALAGVVVACGSLLHTELYHRGAYLLPVRFPLLLCSAAMCFGTMYLFSRGSLRHRVEGTLTEAVFEVCGKGAHLRVLCDTGNTLCDEVTGAPVLVAEASCLSYLWPEQVRPYLSAESLSHPEQVLAALATEDAPHLRLLAYRSVGTSAGLLPAFTAEHAQIGNYRTQRLTVALSPTPVSEQKEYDALWGGPVQ